MPNTGAVRAFDKVAALHRLVDHANAQSAIKARVSGESRVLMGRFALFGKEYVDKKPISLAELLKEEARQKADDDKKKADEAARIAALPDSLSFDTGAIGFQEAPVGGWARIKLYKNGNFEFNGHFHDSGAPSYNCEFSWIIVDSRGKAFTFAWQLHLNGTFESGSRDGDWSDNGNKPEIAAAWSDLCASRTDRWDAAVNWDLAGLLQEAQDIMKTAGTVISVVVTVVGMF